MSEPHALITLESLQATLHERAGELQAAEGTIHALKLERLAREREISELKARLWALEAARETPGPSEPADPQSDSDADLDRVRTELTMRAQELQLQDRLVAAAEKERATYQAYIEHLEAELAQAQHRQNASSIRVALSRAYAIVRRAIRPPSAG